jgi:catechol 2,3-dioxygenase-like lactoylglutathione lyase family enzyme
MEKSIAEVILKFALRLGERFNDLDPVVREIKDVNERKRYLKCLGSMMSELNAGIVLPIVSQYPEMDPDSSNNLGEDQSFKSVELGMRQTLGYATLVVRDYDEAIAFFSRKLGFDVVEDSPSKDRQGRDKRWVLIAPPGSRGTQILLARASTPEEESRVGNQTGGRVFLFLHTDDFWRDYNAMVAREVKFVREPKEDSYGTVAVFEDLYGNKWDLLHLKALSS